MRKGNKGHLIFIHPLITSLVRFYLLNKTMYWTLGTQTTHVMEGANTVKHGNAV